MYIITGQTATGKTKLALDLAVKHNGEIINCDSRQIYKYLDIVTGKDLTKGSKFHVLRSTNNFDIGHYQINPLLYGYMANNNIAIEQYNHSLRLWLYDIVNPNQYFSSFDYVKCSRIVINQLIKKGKTPIIVGGTYLYIKHLLYGFETENIPPDFKLREKLNDRSVAFLQKTLKTASPKLFNTLNQSDRNNPRRLIRRIEILKAVEPLRLKSPPIRRAGEPRRLSEFGEVKIIGLKFKNKSDLVNFIKNRVEKRLELGAVNEVKKLISLGYSENDPGLKTIGYKQLFDHLNNKLTLAEATSQWITAEVQYAGRQVTFMKKDRNIKWKVI